MLVALVIGIAIGWATVVPSNASAAGLYPASDVLGQPVSSAVGFDDPVGTAVDPAHHRLFVVDDSNRVLVYALTSGGAFASRSAAHILGDVTEDPSGGSSPYNSVPTQSSMFRPEAIAYDSTNNRLFVADTSNNRVLVYDLSGGITNGMNATYVLGQPGFSTNDANTTQDGMSFPLGLAYDATNNRLFVSDNFNARVLVYDLGSGISNGMNAAHVLGQADFTSVADGCSANTQDTMCAPMALTFDATDQLLFVADPYMQRVLVFDLSGGTSDDMEPSHELGQEDFTSDDYNTDAMGTPYPSGLAYDSTTTALYVTDAYTNRVLVFDLSSGISDGMDAAHVLGQSDLSSNAFATSQAGMWAPGGVDIDTGNQTLYVVDESNYRVMLFDLSSGIDDGMNASDEVGQTDGSGDPDFSRRVPDDFHPNSRDFRSSAGTAIDPAHHLLFVADTADARVLVFQLNANNQLVDHTADYVLGQSNFTDTYKGHSSSNMTAPTGVAFDPIHDRLFVSDGGLARVGVYDLSGGITSGMSGSYWLGRSSAFGSINSHDHEMYPTALAYDPTSNYLYVVDDDSDRVLVFNVNPSTISTGENSSFVLGQPNWATSDEVVTQNGLFYPVAVAVDGPNHRLFVADVANRVLVYDTSSLSNGMDASNVLGASDFTTWTALGTPDASTFEPSGLSYDDAHERLFVTDDYANRVLIYDTTSISDGMDASGVIGQADFASGTCSNSWASICSSSLAGSNAYDSASNTLIASEGDRLMIFHPPLEDAPADTATITACGTTPVLRAQPVPGATVAYEFQIATSSGFGSGTIVADSGMIPATDTFTPDSGVLFPGTTYYWRWKTDSTDYGDPRSFTLSPLHLGGGQSGDNSPQWSDGPLAVNEVNGNLLVSLPGPSFATDTGSMGVSVSYNSQSSADMGLGAGWLLDPGLSDSGAPTRLVNLNLLTGSDRLDAVEAQYGDGSSVCFTHVGDTNNYEPPPGSNAILTQTRDGSFSYTGSGTVATYAPDGQSDAIAEPKSIQDVTGQPGKGTLTYSFDTADPTKVTSITDDSGRTVTFAWHSIDAGDCASAIVCVTGPDGTVTWQYIGDADSGTGGRLHEINDGARLIAELGYNEGGLVNELQNANDLDPGDASPGYDGDHSLTVSYDGSNRVEGIENGPITGQSPSTSTWTFAYTPGSVSTTATRAAHGALDADTARTAAGYTTVTPPNQQGAESPKTITVYYDANGNPIERDDLADRITMAGYNALNQLLWSEDADGNPADYSYDPITNALLTTTGPDPDGAGPLSRPVTSYRYDETQIGDASTPGAALTGLQGYYYDNPDLAGQPKLVQNDGAVDFDWTSGGPTGLGVDNSFSVRWTGYLNVSQSGDYTLSTSAADGTRLLINGAVIVDNWVDQPQTEISSAPIALTTGSRYRIELDYQDHTDAPAIQLTWACSGCSTPISDQVIPTTALVPDWENQTSIVSPGGRVSFSHYDQPATGNPDYTEIIAPVNGTDTPLITSYTYDDYGRLSGRVLPNGNTSGTLTDGVLTDAGDPTTSDYGTVYTYYASDDTAPPPDACTSGGAVNQGGLIETKSIHGTHDQTFVYDVDGRTIAKTNAAGTDCMTYDDEGQLTTDQAPGDTNPTLYNYDPAGNVLSISHTSGDDTVGTITYSYDEDGRLTDTVDANGAEAAYTYDADGNRISQTTATGSLGSSTNYTTSYSYDGADQLTSETDPADSSYSFFYDSRGDLQGTQYPNGTFNWTDTNPDGSILHNLNRHGTITSETTAPPTDSAPIADYSYTYNQDGQRTEQDATFGSASVAATLYTYDRLGRLETVVYPDTSSERYCYDPDSNRSYLMASATDDCGETDATSTYSYTAGADTPVDAITAQTGPSHSFTYDGGGTALGDGMLTVRDSDTYTWDGNGRLEDSTVGDKTACYTFSPDGSLKTRIYDSGGSSTCTTALSTVNYLLGDLYETDAGGTVTTSYTNGPAGDLASYDGPPTGDSTVDYLYYDGHGDLTAEADDSGAATATHTYSPFGVPIDTPPVDTTSHRYTARWDKQYDSTTSLVLMGARPYDPSIGRFLAVDPIDGGSLNNYDYAAQDPMDEYDLTGRSLWCYKKCKKVNDGSSSVCEWQTVSYSCATGVPLTKAEKKAGGLVAYIVTSQPVGGSWGWGMPNGGYVHTVVYPSVDGSDTFDSSYTVPPSGHVGSAINPVSCTATDFIPAKLLWGVVIGLATELVCAKPAG